MDSSSIFKAPMVKSALGKRNGLITGSVLGDAALDTGAMMLAPWALPFLWTARASAVRRTGTGSAAPQQSYGAAAQQPRQSQGWGVAPRMAAGLFVNPAGFAAASAGQRVGRMVRGWQAAQPQQPVQKPVQPVAPQQPVQPVQPQQQAAPVQAQQSVPPAQAAQVQQPQQVANTNQNQAAPSPNDAQAGAHTQASVRTRKEAPAPAPKPIEPGYRQYVTPEGKVLKGVSVPVAPQPPSSRPAGGSYAGFRAEEMVTPHGRLRSPQEIMHNRREQAYRNRTMYKRSSILDPELVSAGFEGLGSGDGMEKLALSPEVVGRALKAVRALPAGRRVNTVTGRRKGTLGSRTGLPRLEALAAEEDRVNGIIDSIVARPEWQRRAAALHAGNPQAYFRDVANAPFGMMDELGKADWLLMRHPLRGSAATYLNSSLIPRVRSLAYGPGQQPADDLFGNTLRYMNTASLSSPDGVWTDVLKNGFGV